LDTLGDLDFKNEGLEILGLFFVASKKMFEATNAHIPEYLKEYCFINPIKNKTSRFIEYTTLTNPNRTISKAKKFNIDIFKVQIKLFRSLCGTPLLYQISG
jgi:hypothetical protein